MITSRRRVYKNGYLEEIGFFSILELKIEMEQFERSDLIFKISFINEILIILIKSIVRFLCIGIIFILILSN